MDEFTGVLEIDIDVAIFSWTILSKGERRNEVTPM